MPRRKRNHKILEQIESFNPKHHKDEICALMRKKKQGLLRSDNSEFPASYFAHSKHKPYAMDWG